MGHLIMNRKEREQVKVFEQLSQGTIDQTEAAARLRITPRWVRIKMKRYKADGDHGIVHRSRGKVSPNRWNEEQRKFAIDLLNGEWQGFGPTFAAEKLLELHSIKVSAETLRAEMIKEGLWTKKRKRSVHRKKRDRRPMKGMMVQVDGSPHDWFEGRAAKCTMLAFVDDATSEILWIEFAKSESTESLLQATLHYIQKHGIPAEFYTDHGSVFHVNLNNVEGDKKTQWERAIGELDIENHHAHSAQAKGRVERCNKTLQDRLIKEMRLAKISSIEAANEFVKSSFIEKHNQKFAVKPAQSGDAHRDHSLYDLNSIFCIQDHRILANDFTITHNKQIFQLIKEQKTIIRPKNIITVKIALNGSISLWIRKIELAFTIVSSRSKFRGCEEKTISNPVYKPSENSRRWVSGLAPICRLGESRVKPAAAAVEPF
jgi:hypothetical protein